MILFVGEEDNGYFVRETAKRMGEELDFTGYSPSITGQMEQILDADCRYIIFDIGQYLDKPEALAEEIRKIEQAKSRAAVIIYAPGYSRDSAVIRELSGKGIRRFILSSVSGDAKEELERCLSGEDVPGGEETASAGEGSEPRKALAGGGKIGIAGACGRIGTTTVALQLVKHLQMKGYRACYIQVNSSGYVEALKDYFYTAHDEYMGKVTFEEIDLFYRQENISEVLTLGYDYYVYDFGDYSGRDFNKLMYQEKDLRIFVLGSKASELSSTNEVLRNEYYRDVCYVFNYVSDAEQKDVLELMEERAEQTFFSGYAPDPFSYTSSSKELFEKLLPVADRTERNNRKGLLGRFTKRGNKRQL